MPFFTNLEILTGLRTLGPRYNRVNHINLKIWTFSWWTLCRMMALQVLQNVTQCGPNWHNVKTCRMLALFNLVTTYLVWLRQLRVRWVGPIYARWRWFFQGTKSQNARHITQIHSLPTTAAALGQQLPGCLSQATAKFKGVMYDYVKSDCCAKKIYCDFCDALLQQPSVPMLLQEDARAVVSDAAEV